MYVVFVLLLSISGISAFSFDMEKAIEIPLNAEEQVKGSYFGYSLLLRKGNNPVVIVGAPKYNKAEGGAVFACTIYPRENRRCIKYNMTASNFGSTNGNFLGSVIVGGDNEMDTFLVCAPRNVFQTESEDPSLEDLSYWLRGFCFYQKSSATNETIYTFKPEDVDKYENFDEVNKLRYFNYGFGQIGFDAYFKDSSSVYLGAVGIVNWQGSVVNHSLDQSNNFDKLTENFPTSNKTEYLGYKVDYGTFSGIEYIIVGAPRSDDLRGKVILINDKIIQYTIDGEGQGSYFGSALLAVDVNNDKSDELFVGAPMSSGTTFDEGCVYYYKSVQSRKGVKLEGRNKKGARFGTNIVSLGDFDLDSYNDIAISAPFEDDGIGAVYIFMGSSKGVGSRYSQILTPSMFSSNMPRQVKGFGTGLSRGVDVDGNGYTDLAIGAYISDKVFLIPTKPVIDIYTTLEANVTSITDTGVSLTYCFSFKPRANISQLKEETFELRLSIDDRVIYSGNNVETIMTIPEKKTCKSINVTIQETLVNFIPYTFSITVKVFDNVYANGINPRELSIPSAHGCGSDNVCQTKILLHVTSNSKSIILGEKKSVRVNVSAENSGEPGYQCDLYISGSRINEIKLNKQCSFQNQSYMCPFANKINNITKETINFDLSIVSNDIELKHIKLDFELKCLGENEYRAYDVLELTVSILSSPYIEGTSSPANIEIFNDDADNEETRTISHVAIIGNFGPSPIKTDVYFKVPIIKIGDKYLFKLIDIKIINHNNNSHKCHNVTKMEKFNITSHINVPMDITTILSCFNGWECLTLFCEGSILSKSSETVKYELIFETDSKLLAKYIHNQPEYKNILAFVTSAFISNGTMINTEIPTLILSTHTKGIPTWVYIVATILGILLLILIIYLLFKFKFFKRHYRERLNSEKGRSLTHLSNAPLSSYIKNEDVEDDEEELVTINDR